MSSLVAREVIYIYVGVFMTNVEIRIGEDAYMQTGELQLHADP